MIIKSRQAHTKHNGIDCSVKQPGMGMPVLSDRAVNSTSGIRIRNQIHMIGNCRLQQCMYLIGKSRDLNVPRINKRVALK